MSHDEILYIGLGIKRIETKKRRTTQVWVNVYTYKNGRVSQLQCGRKAKILGAEL